MFLLLASFLAGVLTSLAPCILPLLPVIVGSSALPGNDVKQDRKKPYVIAISLGLSVILFTLLLKASTVFIGIDPKVWLYLSGGIVILLGISMLLPNLWVRISAKLGFESSSNKLLASANRRGGFSGQILTGAALGPVFSSCSPVYALVLATVLPVNLALGLIYIVAYAAGLSLALLAIALAGRKITNKLGWAANPSGWFRKGLAIILIIVGIGIIGGYDKKFQAWAIDHLPFDATQLELKLLPQEDAPVTVAPQAATAALTKFNVESPYQAPEIKAIQSWVNSKGESLEKLRGKVVLVDFWTYSCINCIRTQPYLNAWHDKYEDKGLVILGIHAPEFAFEKVPKNVAKAVTDAKIGYPVGLDNDFGTWNAYNNQYWPAKYLIDKNGLVRYTHFGEGEYGETETAIQTLLKETGAEANESLTKEAPSSLPGREQTHETYLGYERGERFANTPEFKKDTSVIYSRPDTIASNQWSLSGSWKIKATESISTEDDATLRIKFSAKEVYLVMHGNGKPAQVKLNGQPATQLNQGGSDVDKDGNVRPASPRLYKLIQADSFIKDGLLEITLPANTTINAFTFGS